jgi:hypothetical protein
MAQKLRQRADDEPESENDYRRARRNNAMLASLGNLVIFWRVTALAHAVNPIFGSEPAVARARLEMFVAAYIANGGNGYRAIMKVKPWLAASSAIPQASRWTDTDEFKELYARRATEIAQQFSIDQYSIIEEVARIALTDRRALFDEQWNLKPIDEIDDAAAAAIAGVEHETRTTAGENGETITTIKVKTYDKLKALDMLMKHKGLFKADNEQQVNPLQALIELVQNRSTGLAGLGGRPILDVQSRRTSEPPTHAAEPDSAR